MKISENISLRPYNTFGVDVSARQFITAGTVDDVLETLSYIKQESLENLILGGGSNVLFTKNFDGVVLNNAIKGITIVNEDAAHVYVKVSAGEVWHNFVMYCIAHNWAGVENLALIPGCVGASPMQNIGAYGVEIKDVFFELEAIHKKDLSVHTFNNRDCAFGYRESVFKHQYKDQFVITAVTYRLNKKPVFHTAYGAIQKQLEEDGVKELSIGAIAAAVIRIRSSKLPDPGKIGNAGSFFKNPSVDKAQFEIIKNADPGIVAYENGDGSMKLAAGWLIEQCGLKGYRKGDAGVHARQALVLVNYGNATGLEILQVRDLVMRSVFDKFGVQLTPEVNII